jgi:hypothetical protein
MHVLAKGKIDHVQSGGAADEAGVTTSHVITAIDGKPISVGADEEILVQMLSTRPVDVTFWLPSSARRGNGKSASGGSKSTTAGGSKKGSPSVFRRGGSGRRGNQSAASPRARKASPGNQSVASSTSPAAQAKQRRSPGSRGTRQ